MAIIEVEHLTKEYRLGQLESLKTTALNQFRRLTGQPLEKRALFKALDDVSFSIEEGEVVGIIGYNGAGKSTLLKLLAKITTPTAGRTQVKGRIAPLIEVGAGFVPELTGRENVYLNGSILGLPRKTIDAKFDEIVDFSELQDFIDTPVKRYSSGMKVKLAFAVATSVESEILIVDEVLAVGDLAFQRKCFDRMESGIKRDGKTVLLVSHNIRQIERLSSRVLLLDEGHLIQDGAPKKVCNIYYERVNRRILQRTSQQMEAKTGAIESNELDLLDVFFEDPGSSGRVQEALMHQSLLVRLKLDVKKPLPNADIAIGFHTSDFVYVATFNTGRNDLSCDLVPGSAQISCRIEDLALMPGVYGLRVGIMDANARTVWYSDNVTSLAVNAGTLSRSQMSLQSLVDIPCTWHLPDIQDFPEPWVPNSSVTGL